MSTELEPSLVEASLRATIDHHVTQTDHHARGASIAQRDVINCEGDTDGQEVDLVFSITRSPTQ